MGIYYIAPLLGPSLGSILGGGLTTAFTWRGPFYFLAIMGGIVFMSFLLLFKDTFRLERSITYQNVLKEKLRESAMKNSSRAEMDEQSDINLPQDLEKQDLPAIDHKVIPEIKLGLVDINPFKPMMVILRRTYNQLMLVASGTH